MEDFFNLAIGVAPSLLWLGVLALIYHRHGRQAPKILKVFSWGMLATVPAIAIEIFAEGFITAAPGSLTATVIFTVLIAALVEEGSKLIFMYYGVFKAKLLERPLDGVLLGITLGLGFVTVENILVSFFFGAEEILFRAPTTTLLHAIAAGIIGFYIGLAFMNEKKVKNFVIWGLVIAGLLHSAFNFVILIDTDLSRLLLVIVMVVLFILLVVAARELVKLTGKKESPVTDNTVNRDDEPTHRPKLEY